MKVTVVLIDDSIAPMMVFVEVPSGCSVHDAVQASGLADTIADGDHPYQPSIFGLKVDWRHAVQGGDRIELAPPLRLTPKERRRLLATKKASQ